MPRPGFRSSTKLPSEFSVTLFSADHLFGPNRPAWPSLTSRRLACVMALPALHSLRPAVGLQETLLEEMLLALL